MKILVLVCVGLLLSSSVAFSGDRFTKLFSECFFKCYRSNVCHANTLHFLLKARQQGIDVSPAAYWDLTPFSGGHFYMINVYENARGAGEPREPPYDWIPLENWYNHGIIVFKPEVGEEMVFDFDYKDQPTPVPLSQYIRDMFYRRKNDQILKVRVHRAERLLGELGTTDPEQAYVLETWTNVGKPDQVLLLGEDKITSFKD